jgi:hypothetical protein
MEFRGVGLPNIVVELEVPGSNDGWKLATMTGIFPQSVPENFCVSSRIMRSLFTERRTKYAPPRVVLCDYIGLALILLTWRIW